MKKSRMEEEEVESGSGSGSQSLINSLVNKYRE